VFIWCFNEMFYKYLIIFIFQSYYIGDRLRKQM